MMLGLLGGASTGLATAAVACDVCAAVVTSVIDASSTVQSYLALVSINTIALALKCGGCHYYGFRCVCFAAAGVDTILHSG